MSINEAKVADFLANKIAEIKKLKIYVSDAKTSMTSSNFPTNEENKPCACVEVRALDGFRAHICKKHWEEIRENNKDMRK